MSHVTLKLSHIITYSFKCHFVHLGVNEQRVLYTIDCAELCVWLCMLLNNISQI